MCATQLAGPCVQRRAKACCRQNLCQAYRNTPPTTRECLFAVIAITLLHVFKVRAAQYFASPDAAIVGIDFVGILLCTAHHIVL